MTKTRSSSQFFFHWNNQQDTGLRFKLRNMVLPDDLNANVPEEISLIRNTNFLRSDHIRFWFSNNQEYYASFKSVHLTDTGENLFQPTFPSLRQLVDTSEQYQHFKKLISSNWLSAVIGQV